MSEELPIFTSSNNQKTNKMRKLFNFSKPETTKEVDTDEVDLSAKTYIKDVAVTALLFSVGVGFVLTVYTVVSLITKFLL